MWVNDDTCNGSVDAKAATILQKVALNPPSTPVETAEMFFLRGIDNSARRCRRYVAALPAFYYFTDNMPLFRSRLERENLLPSGDVDPRLAKANSSHVFMISQQYSRKDGSIVDNVACTYIAAATPQPTAPPSSGNSKNSSGDGDGDTGSACFPANAVVSLHDGQPRFMHNLDIGDNVLGKYSRASDVFFFSHRDSTATARFLVISVETQGPSFGTNSVWSGDVCGGNDDQSFLAKSPSITVSPDHYIWTERGLVRARDVRPKSDKLVREDGSLAPVASIDSIYAAGLYAPHTLEGSLVVDGFLVSSYTATISPKIAHALLAPLRFLYVRAGIAVGRILDRGRAVRMPSFYRIQSGSGSLQGFSIWN